MFDYQARVVSVIDEYTVELAVDLGLGVTKTDRFFLFGVDLSVSHMAYPQHRQRARTRLREILNQTINGKVYVLTVRNPHDPYGSYLARILVPTQSGVWDVGAMLVDECLARPSAS
jgi:hypothetical protein